MPLTAMRHERLTAGRGAYYNLVKALSLSTIRGPVV